MLIKYKITAFFIFILFIFSFYFQDRYAISYNDDWNYAFIVNDNYKNFQTAADDNVNRQPVTSFYDAIVSQSRDYFKTNGRFIVHTIVQYLCGTKNMKQFVIINTIVFSVFTLLFILLSCPTKIKITNLLLILSSIWIILPHKGLTFLGNITCSVNYLWACTITLLFILLFDKSLKQNNKPIVIAITSIFAIIAGSIQESFSLGISGALLLYLFLNHKTINKQTSILSIAYITGTLICMMTPANFRRFDDINGMGFHSHCILGILSSPPIILLFIVFIILITKGLLLKIIQDNFIIVTSIIINLAFIIFVAYNGRHQLTSINVLCLILILRIWIKYAYNNYVRISAIILTSIAIISYLPILSIRKNYYDSYALILQRIELSDNGIVYGSEFERNTEIIRKNHLLECNYIDTFTFADWDFFERSLSIYLTKGIDNKLVKEVKQ